MVAEGLLRDWRAARVSASQGGRWLTRRMTGERAPAGASAVGAGTSRARLQQAPAPAKSVQAWGRASADGPLARRFCVVSTQGSGPGGGQRAAEHALSRDLAKFAIFGATGSLLYHLHGKSSAHRQALSLQQSSPDSELAVPMAPPDEYRHPFEDAGLCWRAFYVGTRFIKLLLVFAPLAAASALIPIFAGHTDFKKWYLTLMVRTLEDAGPAFQKLGQWLSMRPDLFQQDVIQALSSLRDDGPRHSFAYTKTMLESAFGCPLEDVFEVLEEEPVASGSVAQVHRGRLSEAFVKDHDTLFREVAVKVLHPGVVESAWIDGDVIFGFVKLLACATGVSLVMPFDRESFCRAMTRQVDFTWEAYNLKQFHQNFRGDAGIEFPRVVAARDCVLIETWCPGKSIANLFNRVSGDGFCAVQAAEPSPDGLVPLVRRRSGGVQVIEVTEGKKKRLAAKIFDMTIKMYLRDNYIHGDLHGGNLLYSTDPEDDRVFVLDAGLTTALQPDWASPFGYLLHSLTTGHADGVADKLLMFNINSAPIDHAAFRQELREVW